MKIEISDNKLKIPAKALMTRFFFYLNLELSRSFEYEAPRNEIQWIEYVNLNQTDKTLILDYKKLHSGHMKVANILARKDFLTIQGFQFIEMLASVARMHWIGDQDVAGSSPTGLATFFRRDWSWLNFYGHSILSATSTHANKH